jgi:hypothetical protein
MISRTLDDLAKLGLEIEEPKRCRREPQLSHRQAPATRLGLFIVGCHAAVTHSQQTARLIVAVASPWTTLRKQKQKPRVFSVPAPVVDHLCREDYPTHARPGWRMAANIAELLGLAWRQAES